ncbi:MAG: hypothetical protein O7G85_13905 [Planctomycetota bacterium]|nr:hypothetical protein [Planctomycetota bacterium]
MNKSLPVFYKYMERRYARQLRAGRFLIGTLGDFRRKENYGDDIGDSGEGTKTIYSDDDMYADRPESIPEFTKSFVKLTGRGSSMVNCQFSKKIYSQDMFLFCGSCELDLEIMDRLSPEYNCVLKILRPIEFINVLAQAIHNVSPLDLNNVYFGHCQYADRVIHYSQDTDVPPALIKDTKYAYQKELRFMLTPETDSINPIEVTSVEASKYCKFVSAAELADVTKRRLNSYRLNPGE